MALNSEIQLPLPPEYQNERCLPPIPGLCLICKLSSSSILAAQIHLGMWSFTRVCQTYWRKPTLPVSQELSTTSAPQLQIRFRQECVHIFCLHTGAVSAWGVQVVPESCEQWPNCCKFLCATAYYVWKTLLPCSHLPPLLFQSPLRQSTLCEVGGAIWMSHLGLNNVQSPILCSLSSGGSLLITTRCTKNAFWEDLRKSLIWAYNKKSSEISLIMCPISS